MFSSTLCVFSSVPSQHISEPPHPLPASSSCPKAQGTWQLHAAKHKLLWNGNGKEAPGSSSDFMCVCVRERDRDRCYSDGLNKPFPNTFEFLKNYLESSQGRKRSATNNSLGVVGRKFVFLWQSFLLAWEGVGETAVLRKSFVRMFSKWSREGPRRSAKQLVVTESRTFGFEFSSHLEFISQTSKYETLLLLFIYFPLFIGVFAFWQGAKAVPVKAGVLSCLQDEENAMDGM